MSHADRETTFRHRLDDLVEVLDAEGIAQLKRLEPTDGWLP